MTQDYGHAAVIDGSTIYELIIGRTENFILTAPSHYGSNFDQGTIRAHLESAFSDINTVDPYVLGLREALVFCSSVLEPYLLYDDLIVDQSSLQSVFDFNSDRDGSKAKLYEQLSSLFVVEPLTSKYKEQIRHSVRSYYNKLEAGEISSIFNLRARPQEDLSTKDILAFKDSHMLEVEAAMFGNSSNSALRALFYHELAQKAGLPLVIHTKKVSHLRELNRALVSDMKEMLVRLTSGVKEEFEKFQLDLNLPPLSYALIDASFSQNRPLIEVAHELKNDSEIVSLRNLLKGLIAKRGGGRIHAAMEVERLSKSISSRIMSRGKYRLPWLCSKKVYLGEIPALSTILKLIGSGDLEIPDVILYERPYITFYDRWINSSI